MTAFLSALAIVAGLLVFGLVALVFWVLFFIDDKDDDEEGWNP